ncbi:hypothetical protein ACIOUE_38640 [Streptomyces xanthochromogenes]|uniref:hypothetical protein n=1 Tax=Streptomyces xanthochromogenes TaxID=67384 RepID=UPI003801E849
MSATAIVEEGYARGSVISVAAGPTGGGEPSEWQREFDESMGWADIIDLTRGRGA